jgi:tetratricopeptide (TPR) repeat protein
VETPVKTQTPAAQAGERYNAGLALHEEAFKLEQKAAEPDMPEDKRAKLKGKIQSTYERAIKEFGAAIEVNPSFHQAYGSLGYAFRRTGDYESALQAYDRALEISPGYAPALEYRAEAYLGLNRIDDAKAAHGELQREDPELAAELLGAMQAWVGQRRSDPAGIGVGTLDAFERWILEQRAGKPEVRSSLRKARTW